MVLPKFMTDLQAQVASMQAKAEAKKAEATTSETKVIATAPVGVMGAYTGALQPVGTLQGGVVATPIPAVNKQIIEEAGASYDEQVAKLPPDTTPTETKPVFINRAIQEARIVLTTTQEPSKAIEARAQEIENATYSDKFRASMIAYQSGAITEKPPIASNIGISQSAETNPTYLDKKFIAYWNNLSQANKAVIASANPKLSTMEGLKLSATMLSSIIPVYGTIKYWNSSPTWLKALNIVMDIAMVSPFASAPVKGAIKTGASGINSSLRSVMSNSRIRQLNMALGDLAQGIESQSIRAIRVAAKKIDTIGIKVSGEGQVEVGGWIQQRAKVIRSSATDLASGKLSYTDPVSGRTIKANLSSSLKSGGVGLSDPMVSRTMRYYSEASQEGGRVTRELNEARKIAEILREPGRMPLDAKKIYFLRSEAKSAGLSDKQIMQALRDSGTSKTSFNHEMEVMIQENKLAKLRGESVETHWEKYQKNKPKLQTKLQVSPQSKTLKRELAEGITQADFEKIVLQVNEEKDMAQLMKQVNEFINMSPDSRAYLAEKKFLSDFSEKYSISWEQLQKLRREILIEKEEKLWANSAYRQKWEDYVKQAQEKLAAKARQVAKQDSYHLTDSEVSQLSRQIGESVRYDTLFITYWGNEREMDAIIRWRREAAEFFRTHKFGFAETITNTPEGEAAFAAQVLAKIHGLTQKQANDLAQAMSNAATATQEELKPYLARYIATQTKTKTDTKTKTSTKTDTQTKLQTAPLTKVQTYTKPQTKPDIETKTQTKTELKAETATVKITDRTVDIIKDGETTKQSKIRGRIRLPVILSDDGKPLTEKQVKGAIGWKQGWIYKVIYPPYKQKNVINSKTPIEGIRMTEGARSAYNTLVVIGGKLPHTIKRDMGIMDITITTLRGGVRPTMRVVRDRRLLKRRKHHSSQSIVSTVR